MKRLGLGLILGVALGASGVALADQFTTVGADHYQLGWTVLVRGAMVCRDPFVRPSEREIECRSGPESAR